MMYVSRKFSGGTILHGDDVLFINGCEDLLYKCLFKSTYFVENSEIIVVHSIKFVQGNTCCVAENLYNTRVQGAYIRNR